MIKRASSISHTGILKTYILRHNAANLSEEAIWHWFLFGRINNDGDW